MCERIAIVTGTNSGIGLLTAVELAKNDIFVIATMRDVNKKDYLIEKAKAYNVEHLLDIVELDVTKPENINELKKYILDKYETVDILVNNAGYCLGGLVEYISVEEYKNQFETNLFGAIEMTKAFLPIMRENKKGQIINIGSVSGSFGFPGMSPYTASKFAIRGFSESLRLELLPLNIYVSIVEPGAFKTKVWDKGLENIQKEVNEDYQLYLENIYEKANLSKEKGGNPKEVAELVAKISISKKPKFYYTVGFGSKFLIYSKRIIPWIIIEKIAMKIITKNRG